MWNAITVVYTDVSQSLELGAVVLSKWMTAKQWKRGRIITEEASIMSTKNAKSLTLKRRKAMKGVLLKVKEGGKDSTAEKIWD